MAKHAGRHESLWTGDCRLHGAVVVSQMRAGPGGVVPVPQVVASYAAYLVWDADPHPPAPTAIDDSKLAESGRGLFLVGIMSEQWCWYPAAGGGKWSGHCASARSHEHAVHRRRPH